MIEPILTLLRNLDQGSTHKILCLYLFGARDNLIYRKHLQGKTVRAIAKEFHLSFQRVHQIIQEVEEEGGEKNVPA